MKKKYELWLDESGDFQNQGELKNKKNQKPSLVGGILIEEEEAEKIDFDSLISPDQGHSCKMGNEKKREIVLPYLERLKEEHGARQVFFENAEYEDEKTNRLLYLRIIAEGVLQLMQTLCAENESVELEIIIARRQDVSSGQKQKIHQNEYKNTIERLLEARKREHKIFFARDSKVEFKIEPAHKSKKLMFADFACNTRLTRNSNAFKGFETRVAALHQDAYIFSLYDIGLENSIKRRLSGGNISDAIMELYLYIDILPGSRKKVEPRMLKLIIERMRSMSYRLIKAQMKQCITEITAYISNTSDYEIGEAFLKSVIKGFINAVEQDAEVKDKCNTNKLSFSLNILLADMCLREGDINQAQKALETCRAKYTDRIDDNIEDVFLYYQLVEKETLLAIDSFDYETACEIMQSAMQGFKTIIQAIEGSPIFKGFLKDYKSEYYGDAICMLIYAKMFLQRENPESYAELCELSDLGLQQYAGPESELERHRQYRAHIEAEAGKFEDAIKWLFKSKLYCSDKINEESLIEFLNEINASEEEISCLYYFMYYLHIMSEAAVRGETRLADIMCSAAVKQEKMMELCGLKSEEESDENNVKINVASISQKNTGISYHPEEIIYWKYGTYQYCKGKYYMAAAYLRKGIKLCEDEAYITMKITAIGIAADLIFCMVKTDYKKEANQQLDDLVREIKELMNSITNENSKKFLQELLELVKISREGNGRINTETLQKISRKITY